MCGRHRRFLEDRTTSRVSRCCFLRASKIYFLIDTCVEFSSVVVAIDRVSLVIPGYLATKLLNDASEPPNGTLRHTHLTIPRPTTSEEFFFFYFSLFSFFLYFFSSLGIQMMYVARTRSVFSVWPLPPLIWKKQQHSPPDRHMNRNYDKEKKRKKNQVTPLTYTAQYYYYYYYSLRN